VTNFKSKLLGQYGRKSPDSKDYNLINLNVQFMSGLTREPVKLHDFLSRIVREKLAAN